MIAIISGCTKEVIGPQGPQGEQGPAGQDGKDGEDGNANVSSFTVTATPSSWNEVGTAGQVGYGYSVSFNSSKITAEILDKGAVLGYQKTTSGEYVALPITFHFNGYTSTFLYGYGLGSVTVEQYDSDFLTVPPSANAVYKFVVIAGSAKRAPESLSLDNYQQVADFYGIEW